MSPQKHTVLACVAATIWAASGAHAGLVTGDSPGGAADLYGDFVIDLSGLVVHGSQGDPQNPLMDLSDAKDHGQEGHIQEYVLLSGVKWDVNIQTHGSAWLSDLRFALTVNTGQSDEEELTIAPSLGDDFGGQGAYASDGWVNLFAMDMGMFVGFDNTIRVEAFSSFDLPVGDIVFGEGSTLTLGLQVPEPGAVPVLALASFIATRRRR